MNEEEIKATQERLANMTDTEIAGELSKVHGFPNDKYILDEARKRLAARDEDAKRKTLGENTRADVYDRTVFPMEVAIMQAWHDAGRPPYLYVFANWLLSAVKEGEVVRHVTNVKKGELLSYVFAGLGDEDKDGRMVARADFDIVENGIVKIESVAKGEGGGSCDGSADTGSGDTPEGEGEGK